MASMTENRHASKESLPDLDFSCYSHTEVLSTWNFTVRHAFLLLKHCPHKDSFPFTFCLSSQRMLPEGMICMLALRVKRLPSMQVDLGSIPGSGRSSGEGNGNPLQYLCPENTQLQYLCPENPLDRGAPVGYSPWGCTESDMTEANSSICAN